MLLIYNARRDTAAKKEFDIVIHWNAFLLRNGRKKVIFNKDVTKQVKCYKASKFLRKKDLSRVYFDMKQTLRAFVSKV